MVRKQYKAGFTLSELIVTIALFAIVTAVVVAFASMINSAARNKTQTMGRIDEEDKIRSMVSDWFYNFDHEDYVIQSSVTEKTDSYDLITDTTTVITSSVVNISVCPALVPMGVIPPQYTLSAYGNTLTATYGTGIEDSVSFSTAYITNIELEWNEDLQLLKCTMSYLDDKSVAQVISFVLYRYVG